jgi:broad specificity phosphatase PhoE
LLRHGQSTFQVTFDVTRVDPMTFDAELSEKGALEARTAAAEVARLGIDLLVTSPLTRALQTSLAVLEAVPATPLIVHPLLRERLDDSCDVGTPASLLAARFHGVDFGGLEETWWHTGNEGERGFAVEPRDGFRRRVQEFRDWLLAREESRILVVSHVGVLFELCGVRLENCVLYSWNVEGLHC